MKLTHVGIVVEDIEYYLKKNVISISTEIVYDNIQDAYICFITEGANSIGIELIQPKSKNSMVYKFLVKKGGGLHHLCYSVNSIEEAMEIINKKEMILVFGPVRAIALDAHFILFAYTRNRELIEMEVVH